MASGHRKGVYRQPRPPGDFPKRYRQPTVLILETEKQNKDIAENNTEEQKDEDEESGEEETDFVKEFGPDTKLTKDTIVSVYAQGKAFALAIGVMEMDSEEIEKTKTGLAVKIYTFVGDELFSLNLNN